MVAVMDGLESMRFQSELQPGEFIEWAGRPSPWRIFTLGDLLLIPASVVWSGFFFFFFVWSSVLSGELSALLFAILVAAFALYLTVGRFLYALWDRRHTWYAVTSQRIIILSTTFGRRVHSIYFNTLPQIEKRIARSGRGSLIFGPPPPRRYGTNANWSAGSLRGRAPGFFDISDAQRVFVLIDGHRRGQ